MKSGVEPTYINSDKASGKHDKRPGLENWLMALRQGDVLGVWKLDRLGRNLRYWVNTVQDLSEAGVGFKVQSRKGANSDTTTARGKIVFGLFAALTEFECALSIERTKAGLETA